MFKAKTRQKALFDFCVFLALCLLHGSFWLCGCGGILVYDVKDSLQVSSASDFAVFRLLRREAFSVVGEKLIKLDLNSATETVLWETSNPDIEITDFTIAPDGSFVVIKGDLVTSGVVQLFRLEMSGGDPLLLSQNNSSNLEIEDYAISADSSTVVFFGDAEIDGVVRLYSVPASGGNITTLSNNSGTSTDLSVVDFQIAPSSSVVVFKGDTEINNVLRLYSVGIDGGGVSTISTNTTADTSLAVNDYLISDDSRYVVYSGDNDVDGVERLYSVLLSNNTHVNLTTNTDAQSNIEADFRISPDGGRVVFRGYIEGDHVLRLYSVPIDGNSSVVTISNNTTSDTSLRVSGFSIAPDSAQVVFVGDTLQDDVDRLFSVAVDGGSVLELLSGLGDASMESDMSISDFTVTPDSQFVVFIGEIEAWSLTRVYKIALEGGSLIALSQDTGSDPDRDAVQFWMSDDGQCVVYYGDIDTDGNFGLYSNSIEATSIQSLVEGFGSTADIYQLFITADSNHVVVQSLSAIQAYDICTN